MRNDYRTWRDWSKDHKVKCNCGHHAKHHYAYEGCCRYCGCTWYYPNDRWILRMKKKKLLKQIFRKKNSKYGKGKT